MSVDLTSTPYFCGFRPVIPYQAKVIDLLDSYNYQNGILEILLSGSYGSAKSILLAHLTVWHCTHFEKAGAIICRKAWPDLEKTIWKEILDHMSEDFEEGTDYEVNNSKHTIEFANGSIIYAGFWSDKRYKKFRSLKLSCAVFEELTENNEEDMEAFKQIKARLNRITHIKENILAAATNPDSPTHWVYDYFILPNTNTQHQNRHVFFSKAFDNPFLDVSYIQQLMRDLPEKEVRRFINGEWIEINREMVYFEYKREQNFMDSEYEINEKLPIILSYDFNIGEGKPLSMCLLQYDRDRDTFSVFDEVVIEGARTADVIEELETRGYFLPNRSFIVCGDASGSHRDTRGARSDYDIIRNQLSDRNVNFEYHVPPSNPPVRHRHNTVNAYCKNGLGETRLFVYKKAKTVDQALRLTQLKKGAGYIEDDSKPYQHVGTALGYAICFEFMLAKRQPSRMHQR